MKKDKKQFILIMTDTQRKDMIGAYGRGDIMATPSLDALAQESLVFDRAYTCQPVCGPARSAIFTGQFPHTNGMIGNCMFLGENTRTVGQRLSKAGVRTSYIGKWHLDGGDYFGNGICPDGWDPEYWYDMRNFLDELSEEDRLKSRNFQSCFEDRGIEADFTYAYKCTNRAIDYVKRHKDDDYFLVLSYDEPHHPFLAPKEFFEAYYKGEIIKKDNQDMDVSKLPEHIRLWHEKYISLESSAELGLLGCNAFIDTQIARFMEAAKECASDACILYTSDHGDSLGSHGIHTKGAAMYEEIANIPLMLRVPNKTENIKLDKLAVSHIDIVPTILDYFDVKKPKALSGTSLLSLIEDKGEINEEAYKEIDDRGAHIEFTRYEIDHDGFGGFQPIRSIVKGGKKLVINLMCEDELYDLDKDPQEMKNLILDEEYVQIRNALHDDILNWMNDTRDPFRGYYWARRPWRKEKKASWDNDGMTRRRYTEPDEVRQLDYLTGLEFDEQVRKN